MDTSKEYIKMCEKAGEIQELAPRMATRIHTKNNIYICSDYDYELGGFFYCIDIFGDEEPAVLESTRSVWLPRQDELQEMLDKPKRWADSAFEMLCSIYDFSQDWIGGGAETMGLNDFGEYLEKLSSAEQVWLAFVMAEKYKKTWDGEKWIKKIN